MTELTCYKAINCGDFSPLMFCLRCGKNETCLYVHEAKISDCGCIRRKTNRYGREMCYGDPYLCKECMEENFDHIHTEPVPDDPQGIPVVGCSIWATKIVPPVYGKNPL